MIILVNYYQNIEKKLLENEKLKKQLEIANEMRRIKMPVEMTKEIKEHFKQNNQHIVDFVKLSIKLKQKGHDLFIDWSPHVLLINIRLYINSWQPDKSDKCDLWSTVYLNCECDDKVNTIKQQIFELTGVK